MHNHAASGFDLQAAIGTAGTLVALLGVIATLLISRRGQKQDLQLAKADAERAERAERAGEASAERAENAAALTIDTMSRMADALDNISSQGIGSNPIPIELTHRVAWALTHYEGDMYMLTNTGDATAYNVRVSAHESLIAVGEWPSETSMKPNDVITFMAVRTFGTTDSTITVVWGTEHDGDRDVWRYPLPPRPPRS